MTKLLGCMIDEVATYAWAPAFLAARKNDIILPNGNRDWALLTGTVAKSADQAITSARVGCP